MIGNVNNFIFKVSMIIFFIIAISLFLYSQSKISELLDLGEKSYLNSQVLDFHYKEHDAYYVYGYEIISQKISHVSMKIIVEGITINTKSDLLTIKQNKKYSRVIEFDEKGQINALVYKEQ